MSPTEINPATASVSAGHKRWIRITHWIIAASVLALAVSGFTILMAHPRLYWGAVGNDLTPALFELPVSRNYRHGGWELSTPSFPEGGPAASAIRTYHILNENSWARSLHFLSAWFLVVTGLIYLVAATVSGHLRRNLLPHRGELRARLLRDDLSAHLQLHMRPAPGGPPYGLLQKCTYCGVVFLGLPLMVWTGLAMSPAINAAYPFLSGVFGGAQSARTIHFCVFVALILFVLIHMAMVSLSGFRWQMRAMTFGKPT